MRKHGLYMIGVEFGKEVIQQKQGIFFGQLLDELDKDELEAYKNRFVFSSGKVFMGDSECGHLFFVLRNISGVRRLESLRYRRAHEITEIIQVRTYIGMSGDDIPLSVCPEIRKHTCLHIFALDLGNVLECESVFIFQERFQRTGALPDKIRELLPIGVVCLGSLDKKRVPEIQCVLPARSFANLLEEAVAVLEGKQVLPFDFGKFRKRQQYGLVEKVPPETGPEIQDIHLHRSEQDCPKRHKLAMTGSCDDIVLGKEAHLSFPSRVSDPSGIREVVFYELSAYRKHSRVRRNQLQKNPLGGRDGIDEEIDRFQDIGLPRTVRAREDILVPPGK